MAVHLKASVTDQPGTYEFGISICSKRRGSLDCRLANGRRRLRWARDCQLHFRTEATLVDARKFGSCGSGCRSRCYGCPGAAAMQTHHLVSTVLVAPMNIVSTEPFEAFAHVPNNTLLPTREGDAPLLAAQRER